MPSLKFFLEFEMLRAFKQDRCMHITVCMLCMSNPEISTESELPQSIQTWQAHACHPVHVGYCAHVQLYRKRSDTELELT